MKPLTLEINMDYENNEIAKKIVETREMFTSLVKQEFLFRCAHPGKYYARIISIDHWNTLPPDMFHFKWEISPHYNHKNTPWTFKASASNLNFSMTNYRTTPSCRGKTSINPETAILWIHSKKVPLNRIIPNLTIEITVK